MPNLHPRLEADCVLLGHFPLCRLLLSKDSNYPWFLLVPDRDDIQEIHELSDEDQAQLIRESSYVSRTLAQRFDADKMNVAAIGNVVPQLHVHHIVRYESDPAWPSPVWNHTPAVPYSDEALKERCRDWQTWVTEDPPSCGPFTAALIG
ncbi:MAG: HIT domain-containing protein [Planctomycetota bacterium]